MSTKLDQYLAAAKRERTTKAYASAIRHFEVDWGGMLPASGEGVARYLADHAESLTANTLRQRLAALGHWHSAHGFVDPTRMPIVKQALRGIRVVHARVERQATPLQLTDLGRVAEWQSQAITHGQSAAGHRGRGPAATAVTRTRTRVRTGVRPSVCGPCGQPGGSRG